MVLCNKGLKIVLQFPMKMRNTLDMTAWHVRLVLHLFIVHMCVLRFCAGHPQCLDFRPPFQAGSALTFCPQYSVFGCCTVDDDRQLRTDYGGIRNNVPSALWRECGGYLREFMCLKCSPYAAHIFDAEESLIPRSFPGLCRGYCKSFHNKCAGIVKYMTSDPVLRRLVSDGADAFCEQVGLADNSYCFPDLETNDILNKKISIVQVTSKGCICMEEIASGLRNPVFARHAGDGTNRLFVGEVTGQVQIYFPNGSKIQEPFLDIQENVMNTKSEGDERGFLGMAFHPRFKENNKFYIYYSTWGEFGSGNHVTKISEMMVSEDNPNKADRMSERVLLTINQPYWNHNGGEILFGDDNYLYLFVGDGGAAGDPENRSQNRSLLLGKVLRIDIDRQPRWRPYGIPPDNPFVDEDGVRPEIYAYGVRNMWRCGKDRGDPVTGEGKGRIVCGDVGQSSYEELDVLKKGANYGWNALEGMSCFRPDICDTIRGVEDPIHTYPHSIGMSVTGGHFYRGCNSPNLNGFYIYGDFMSGKLWRLIHDPVTREWENEELQMCTTKMCRPPLQSTYVTSIISFGEDEDGEVYMVATSQASSGLPYGKVYRIVDPARRGNPDDCRSARHEEYDTRRVNTTLYRHA
ncbi:HHIP-like protein 1 isoform X3 [Ylistrum balloti]|uniref:HHIP-like protein 1 isoform X3 n=1 Tax=Ylistrum balloti TaxID=509963 RepID=UPI002905BF77|nr:HHIP-like protein 1 isoform X3 [Ylistrum balloti]